MQFTLVIQNKYGQLDLTTNENFILTDIDGMTQSDVTITAQTMPLADGSTVTDAQTKPRSMVLYLTMKDGVNIEEAKRNIFAVVKPKQESTLRYKHNGRDLTITGTVESITMARFTRQVVMQIKLYCGYPYWQDARTIIENISRVLALHHFELTITAAKPIVFGKIGAQMTRTLYNAGDVATGLQITFVAAGDISNPRLERASDGAYFQINTTMERGDKIVINTTKGHKSVKKNDVNIINLVAQGSTWFQMNVGQEEFTTVEAGGSELLHTYFEFKRAFI